MATVAATGDNRIGLYFREYGEGNIYGEYAPGALLLQLERHSGDRLVILWGEIPSLIDGQIRFEPDDGQIMRSSSSSGGTSSAPLSTASSTAIDFPVYPNSGSTAISIARMGIGGVSLGASEAEVRQMLGEPLTTVFV